MKKNYTLQFTILTVLFSTFLLSSVAQTDVANGDFEKWETRKIKVLTSNDTVDYHYPSFWLSATDILKVSLGTPSSIKLSENSQSGSYALETCLSTGTPLIEVINVFGCKSRPNKVRGYYKFSTISSDTITISATAVGGADGSILGSGKFIATERTGDYVSFSVDINYSSQEAIDSLVITILLKGNGLLPVCSTFDNFTLDYSSGTNNNFVMEGIDIGPNPFSNNLFVKNNNRKDISVKLFDITGKLLNTNDLAGRNFTNIDTSNLNPGLYLVKFEDETGVITTKKFIKQSTVN